MVALQQDEGAPSLIEMGARKLAAVRSNRKTPRDRPAWLRTTWGVLGDILGTLVALVFFVVAAFLAGPIIGYAVAGVAMLLLDFKVSVSRQARASRDRR
jgi:hypothetical protein